MVVGATRDGVERGRRARPQTELVGGGGELAHQVCCRFSLVLTAKTFVKNTLEKLVGCSKLKVG